VAGVSGASGDFAADAALADVPGGASGAYRQQALGADLEWSGGHLILRAEAVFTRHRLPAVEATLLEDPLDSFGVYGEGRYKFGPGLYAALRLERLAMAELPSRLGTLEWDAPVSRIEVGMGWSVARHLLLKASWQNNWREGGRVRESHLVAAQVLLWY
jgi:hypothetical protein